MTTILIKGRIPRPLGDRPWGGVRIGWQFIGYTQDAVNQRPNDSGETFTQAAAKYDETTKLYSLTFDGLQFQFATEGQLRFQMPGAETKFSNLRWQGFAANGDEIGNGGGSVTVVDPTNPNFNTNIQANAAVAQGRAIAKVRYTLTPIAGDEFSFEVTL